MAGAIAAFAVPVLVAIWSPISAIAIDGAIMISFLLSDPWLEHRVGALNAARPPVAIPVAPPRRRIRE